MIPYIHIIGNFHINSFGLMLWLASVAAAIMVDRGFRRARIDADAVGIVAIAVVAGILGAKIWHFLDSPQDFHAIGWRALWDTSGFAWYGGLTCGIAALVLQGIWVKTGSGNRIGGLRILDLSAPAAAVGYGIGRIGCFLSGDGCYGIETKLPFPLGMSFPHGIEPTAPGVRVLPTPLFELVLGLLIGWYLWKRAGKPNPVGMITGQYLLLSGLARFAVEFVRRNPKILWGLSNAQLASLGAALAGAALMAWSARRPIARTMLAEPPVAASQG
jgi:phosphatidylglycerol---prolipoprotein diacylglyceryl transferase